VQIDPVADRGGQVGERTERHDRHLAGVAVDVRREITGRRDRGVLGGAEEAVLAAELDIAGARRAMGVRRRSQPPLERPRGTDADRHVAAPHHPQELAGVSRHVLDLDVAGHARHPAQVELG
jgi:hypothetical protein